MNWKNIGRWVALPIVFIGAYVTTVYLNALFDRGDVFLSGGVFRAIWDGIMHYGVWSLIGALAAVFAGMYVAPSNNKIVAVILAAILAVILALSLIWVSIKDYETTDRIRYIFLNGGGIIGAVIAGIIGYKSE